MKFKYKITKEFIEYRNKRKELFEKSNKRRKDNRTETIKLMHADCELLEYVVCEMKLHKNANTSKFDTISEIYNRCEFKCTGDSGTVTLKPFCLEQDFDHFVIWEFVTPHDRPLVEGDEVIPINVYMGVGLAATATETSDYQVILVMAIDSKSNRNV